MVQWKRLTTVYVGNIISGEWTEVRRRRRLPSRSYEGHVPVRDIEQDVAEPTQYEELEFEFDEDLLKVRELSLSYFVCLCFMGSKLLAFNNTLNWSKYLL